MFEEDKYTNDNHNSQSEDGMQVPQAYEMRGEQQETGTGQPTTYTGQPAGYTGQQAENSRQQTVGAGQTAAYTSQETMGSGQRTAESGYRETNRMDMSYMPEEPVRSRGRQSGGKKVAGLVAGALLFGVVAGGTMFGVNTAAEYMKNRLAPVTAAEETEPEVTVSKAETQAAEASPAIQIDVAKIVEDAMPSVVAINNTMVTRQQTWFGFSQDVETASSGSGIIVGQNDEELLIVTNNHVVESAKDTTVTFIDDSQVAAVVKGTDSESDLAVIAVPLEDISEETMAQIKIATIGDSDELKVGEGVIAIGNALGYGQSVTVGVVSALNREVKTDESTSQNLLQTDAAINPGNSGGALLNMRGELIGINAAKYSSTSVEGMGYAIPISQAEDIINELMNKRTHIVVEESKQGYLGIQGNNIDESAAEMYGMPRGVYVYKIMEGSAAAASDLREKDIITKFDGQTVKTMAELKTMLTYYEAGSTVDLTVQTLQDGEYVERTVTITLGEREEAETN